MKQSSGKNKRRAGTSELQRVQELLRRLEKLEVGNAVRSLDYLYSEDSLIRALLAGLFRADINIDVDEVIINALYGIQRHPSDYHRYGYTKKSMTKILNEIGFEIFKYEIGRTGYPKNTVGWKIWARKK